MISVKTQKAIILSNPNCKACLLRNGARQEPQELDPGVSTGNGVGFGLAQRVVSAEFGSLVLDRESPVFSGLFASPLSSPLNTSSEGNREAYTYPDISILDYPLFVWVYQLYPAKL